MKIWATAVILTVTPTVVSAFTCGARAAFRLSSEAATVDGIRRNMVASQEVSANNNDAEPQQQRRRSKEVSVHNHHCGMTHLALQLLVAG